MEGNEHALVPPIVDVRDNLGTLAVQVLAAREDLSKLSNDEMLDKLTAIVVELHSAYGSKAPIT
jgi:hypothetical protein